MDNSLLLVKTLVVTQRFSGVGYGASRAIPEQDTSESSASRSGYLLASPPPYMVPISCVWTRLDTDAWPYPNHFNCIQVSCREKLSTKSLPKLNNISVLHVSNFHINTKCLGAIADPVSTRRTNQASVSFSTFSNVLCISQESVVLEENLILS